MTHVATAFLRKSQEEVMADSFACHYRAMRPSISREGIETIAFRHWTSSGDDFIF